MLKASRLLAISSALLLLGACGSDSSSEAPAPAPVIGQAPESAPAPVIGQAPAGIEVGGGETPPAGAPVDPQPVPAGQRAEIPKMYIDVAGGAAVADKENYLEATVRIESGIQSERLAVSADIRGRGNATWEMPKKPYRLRLETASAVLGMPKERDWALLANYADQTLARNRLAMMLGERMGMVWTPRSRFVELYLNGRYDGVYQVFEHVKTGSDRANVESLDRQADVDPEQITGGWLLEIDKRYGEEVCWNTLLDVPICVKSPGLELNDVRQANHPSAVQLRYIQDYVEAAERALLDQDGEQWRGYFDVPALIDWYLVNELMRNYDAKFVSSVYLHKRRGGPLVFGPLWDFDIAGQFEYEDGEKAVGWWVRDSTWHQKMFSRPDFRTEVFQRWCGLNREGVIGGIDGMIDEIVATIGTAPVDRNFERWDILDKPMPPFFDTDETTYLGEVDYLKKWLGRRVSWMDGEYRNEFGACPAAAPRPAATGP